MPLVSMLATLKKAQEGGHAVPCFCVFEAVSGDGMVAAAEEQRSPLIAAIYDRFIDKPDARPFAAYLRARAAESAAPVSLTLDHGASFEMCIRALRLGLTDVMFDGSRLPLDENIARTREVVRAAHAAGAGCEGEIGIVGAGSSYAEFGALGKGVSDPAEVERFAAETGADCVAVAIGSAHGEYNAPPRLDLERLAEIRRRVSVPLALHGGSGLPEDQFRSAIAGGIAKVNVFTDLGLTCARRVAERAARGKLSYFDVTREIRESFRERCGYYMQLFGASGKA